MERKHWQGMKWLKEYFELNLKTKSTQLSKAMHLLVTEFASTRFLSLPVSMTDF